MHLKIASPAEKNYTESSEETHQPLHVVSFEEEEQLCGQAQIKSHGQTMWSEQRSAHHSFLRRCCIVTLVMGFVKPFSQFVCYSSVGHDELNAIYRIRNSGMQGSLKIKINAQNLIRSKQRKASSQSSPSSRRYPSVHT